MAGPISYEQLINQITDRYEALGRRSRDIARYVVQNPNEIALNSAKGIAERVGVEASSLVRFAQGFGFSGFAEMQRIFQSRLLTAAPGYAERPVNTGWFHDTGTKLCAARLYTSSGCTV